MPRYIDENELKYVFSSLTDAYSGTQFSSGIYIAKIECETLPTADVEPVRHGRWIEKSHEWDFPPYFYTDFTCSNCGIREQDKAPYCRYCGAKMDEEENQCQ